MDCNPAVILFIVISISGLCIAQNTQAEIDGTAEVSVLMNVAEFTQMEQQWRSAIAWHSSRHCKRGKDNCWAADKQIRYHDVVITNVLDQTDFVDIRFHIRDRYDHEQAGMSSQQVRSFYFVYEVDVETEFGQDMTFLSPGEPGMEGWLIAVIVISCVVGVALIVTVAVLATRQHKYKAELERQKTISDYRIQSGIGSDFTGLPDDKSNLGYGLSHKPGTSGVGSNRTSVEGDGHGLPPAYTNHGVQDAHHYNAFDHKTIGPGTDTDSKKEDDNSYQSINL